MSAISSITDSSLYQWLQQLNPAQAGASSSTTTAQTGSTTTDAADGAQATADPTSASPVEHHHHHHHGGGGGESGFAQKIESAVTTALQNAPAGSDPNQTVKNAIAQALQNGNGNDPAAGGQTNANGSPTSTASPASTSSSQSTSQSTFDSLLQANGISPQQFQQDLQDSFSSTQPNSVNFATLFQSFPPGSLVQATA